MFDTYLEEEMSAARTKVYLVLRTHVSQNSDPVIVLEEIYCYVDS